MRLSSAPSVYDAVCKPALQSSLYLMFVTALGTQAERCLVSHRAWTSLSFSAPESLRRAILSLALGVLVLMANVDLFWKSYKDHRTQSARTATATSRTYLKRPKKNVLPLIFHVTTTVERVRSAVQQLEPSRVATPSTPDTVRRVLLHL
jgi:hypothetical protein